MCLKRFLTLLLALALAGMAGAATNKVPDVAQETYGPWKDCLVLRGGKFHAFQDTCTHSGESLSKGNINYLGEVICPGHGYCFSVNTGREANERSRDLEMYLIKEDESGFYIGI